MANYKGAEYLKRRLNSKRSRVRMRYNYYEMKNRIKDFQVSTPPELRNAQTVLGWCGKAVDNLADRIVFRGFAEDNFDIEQIFAMNNPDTFFDSAVLSALISACCFVYISEDNEGYPRLRVIDGSNATGIIDQSTGLLKEGYAVLERDSNYNPITEAYFAPGLTRISTRGRLIDVPNNVDHPLLVPIIFRPDAA